MQYDMYIYIYIYSLKGCSHFASSPLNVIIVYITPFLVPLLCQKSFDMFFLSGRVLIWILTWALSTNENAQALFEANSPAWKEATPFLHLQSMAQIVWRHPLQVPLSGIHAQNC